MSLDLAHALLVELADVHQAVGAGQDLDEGAEVGQALDQAHVELADLGLGGEALDDVDGLLGQQAVGRGDVDRAVVLDVDGHAGLRGDAPDGLAARADDVADLVGLDVDGEDARGVLVQLLARGGQRLGHLAQDVEAAALRLLQRLLEDRAGQALDLDVHLHRGHAGLGAADLEVHVAQVVLVAEDVGEHGHAVAFLDEAHGDAAPPAS